MRKKAILPLVLGCILLSSCVVSKKKYEIAEAGRWAALYSRDSLADLLGHRDTTSIKHYLNLQKVDEPLSVAPPKYHPAER